jgi:hypothetical protein
MTRPEAIDECVHPPLPSLSINPVRGSRSDFRRSLWIAIAIAVPAGLIAGFAGNSKIDFYVYVMALESGAGLIAFLGALIVSSVLHECGHLLTALLLNFSIFAGSFGPLSITRMHGKWSLRIRKMPCLASISAVPKATRGWRMRMIAMIAAGPAMYPLVATVSVWLLSRQNYTHLWQLRFLADMAALNSLLFALSMFPNSPTAPVWNDSRQILALLRRGYHRGADCPECFCDAAGSGGCPAMRLPDRSHMSARSRTWTPGGNRLLLVLNFGMGHGSWRHQNCERIGSPIR